MTIILFLKVRDSCSVTFPKPFFYEPSSQPCNTTLVTRMAIAIMMIDWVVFCSCAHDTIVFGLTQTSPIHVFLFPIV